MALTALKVQDMEDKGFMGLFDDHKALWEAKAKEAYTYTANVLNTTGEPVRPDDVLPLLVPALEVADEFRSFLDEKRLTQKYWKTHFGELVLDRLWDPLTTADEEGNG